jgi:soluble lytic murein transglycosylase-like protein
MAAWLLLLGPCLCVPGWAEIYAYTADDGSVSLSNVPSDPRYTLLVPPPVPADVATPPADARRRTSRAAKADYDRAIDEVARAYGLETALLHAVISVESRYDARAVSRKGAVGLMQLMPQTAKRYGVADAFDPRQNLEGGARYLKDLLGLFNNDVSLALAAYNAGEQAVMKHGNRIPPYSETLRYVPLVLDFYQRFHAGPRPG